LRALLELVQLLRVVEPLPQEQPAGAQVTVRIGVALPHLPADAQYLGAGNVPSAALPDGGVIDAAVDEPSEGEG
jgi:hypothetical protein